MKKLLSIALLIAFIFGMATTVKAATPSEDLYAYASKTFTIAGQEVKLLGDAELVKVKRYLDENSITAEQYNTVKEQIDNAVAVMNKAGVTDVTKLKGADEEAVKGYVNVAAAALNLTVTYNAKDGSVEIYNADGKLVDVLTASSTVKFVQTGEAHYEYIAVPVVAIIAVAIVTIYKKVTANA